VFFVPELGRTFAELTKEEKSALSHRGRAFAEMRGHLLALR
jgi:XTP/dITP diphosphohydrolase